MFPQRPAASPGLTQGSTPQRVNPFSQRQDLKGGRIKLFDTPSKSLISLTFDLPPPSPFPPGTPITPEPAVEVQCDFSDLSAMTRRCRSLPASPELPRRGQPRPVPHSSANGLLALDCSRLETPSSSGTEPMDCRPDASPDPEPPDAPPAASPAPPPLTNSNFISTAVSRAQPWPPNGLLLNNNNKPPHGWGGVLSELSVPPTMGDAVQAEHANAALALSGLESGRGSTGGGGVMEQDEVLSCPACCLGPFSFSFASVCHRPSANTPRYQNLNCEAKNLQCPEGLPQRPLHKGLGPGLSKPSLKLPEAQS
ncbi:hypothetical protein JD844_015311 [Phrynosoma platyrhinos]|uniref:Uncharacterized protein n=1 Tax=Phrynosoma platyrhinos TaxID=52577 RepID=A0ABQ7SIT8_PHRPL|nr:hypothetical protein JD844_015311 [Phrynosoma platyrhinos]